MNNLPFELFYWEIDKDLEISIWYYPVIELARIYLNKKLFDTIDLKKKAYRQTWTEHQFLGRVQV